MNSSNSNTGRGDFKATLQETRLYNPRSAATGCAGQESLDLDTVINVSQALRDELDPDRLIQIFVSNAMLHACAQRALLVLMQTGAPLICAIGRREGEEPMIERVSQVPDSLQLPVSILYRVMRTHLRLVFDDVAQDAYFGSDQYLAEHRVRSVLCVPLLKQSQLIGILHLENNHAAGVFSPSRSAVVELLAGQTAISLEAIGLQHQLREENARRKETESALRSARAELSRLSQMTVMGELAASIAHEINQPLASMISNASASLRWLNRAHPKVDEASSGLHDIMRQGKRAGEIVNALQSLARQGPHHRRRLLVNDVIAHVVALINSDAEQQRVLMTTSLTDSPLQVHACGVQLQQVVLNLILNALDALSAGDQVLRRLSITSEVVGDDYIVVSVEDSGPGVAPQIIDQLFNAFFTTKDKGMGMGLAICHSILQAHAGHLYVMPARFGGATFVFTLPVVR